MCVNKTETVPIRLRQKASKCVNMKFITKHDYRRRKNCFIIPLLKNKVMRLSAQYLSPEGLVTEVHKGEEIAPLEHKHRALWSQFQK